MVKRIVLVGVVVAAGMLLALWLWHAGDLRPAARHDLPDAPVTKDTSADSARPSTPAEDSTIPSKQAGTSSGVARALEDDVDAKAAKAMDYGRTPPVKPDANAQVASAAEALSKGNHPERLSALIQPGPFDKAAYLKDPAAYLNVVEPGRVFQPAQPGPEVPQITSLTPRMQNVVQGDSVSLKVRAIAGMPVTFTSFDLGQFENQLTTMTVAADAEGLAQVKFIGTPGTIGDVNILASCPVASGQLRFLVNVERAAAGSESDGL